MKKSLVFIIVILFGWNILTNIQLWQLKQQTNESNIPQQNTSQPSISQAHTQIATDVSELVQKSENKVVTVVSQTYRGQTGSGSGAIYKQNDNEVFIVTNHHVIETGQQYEVIFANGESKEAQLIGSDVYTDLAVLKVEADINCEAFTMANSDLVQKGEYVIAMGSPLGIEYQGSVSGGLISGINRKMAMDIDNDGISDWDINVLQTDAAINPGNSGGPLINMAGELLGINSMKIADEAVEGFGFAIPINEALPIIQQLESNGKVTRPILGVSIYPLSALSTWEKLYLGIHNTKEGLYVSEVQKNSPAYQAGMRAGDILIALDNTTVNDMKTFRQILYRKNIGEEIQIKYKSGNKTLEKTATLE